MLQKHYHIATVNIQLRLRMFVSLTNKETTQVGFFRTKKWQKKTEEEKKKKKGGSELKKVNVSSFRTELGVAMLYRCGRLLMTFLTSLTTDNAVSGWLPGK